MSRELYALKSRTELTRIKRIFGYAILFDAHSIRSRVPGLFDGPLPDLNLGSYDGRSAAPGLIDKALSVFRNQSRFGHVIDGRFKGGFITRNHGRPEQGMHALQLEMSQEIYMQQDPPEYDESNAAGVQLILRQLLENLLCWRPDHD